MKMIQSCLDSSDEVWIVVNAIPCSSQLPSRPTAPLEQQMLNGATLHDQN